MLRHVNPHTGEEFFVFSCFNQDQHLDFVDFKNLNERLRANSIQEKLTNLWLDRVFGKEEFKKKPFEVKAFDLGLPEGVNWNHPDDFLDMIERKMKD